MATNNQTPNPFHDVKVREQIALDFAKLTSEDTSTQPATPKDEPVKPTPGQDESKKQESVGAPADVTWRKQIPTEYHAAFEGLDEANRTKILTALKQPLWQTADYTKKTQALSAKEKEMQAQLAKYKAVSDLATKYGMGIDEVTQITDRFASFVSVPGAKVIIGDKEVWASPVKADPEPDFDNMTKDEIKAWKAQEVAKERAKVKAEIEAQREAEMAPILEQQAAEQRTKIYAELKSSRPDVSEIEWDEAKDFAFNTIHKFLNSEMNKENLEALLETFVYANRGKGSKTPKQTSIDAPTSPANPAPKKPIKSLKDAWMEVKREKGLI